MVRRTPAPQLAGHVSSYYGFREDPGTAVRRREGPGTDIVVILTFEEDWLIDDERRTSLVGGLRNDQVTTEHPGRSYGMQINLAPPSAYGLFGVPMHLLAHRTVPLDDVLDASFVERVAEAGHWAARFDLLDELLARRLGEARRPSAGVSWAWRRLSETHGRAPVGALAQELGWSRKRIVARFREEVGLPPKAVARLFRFERARSLAELRDRPGWAEIALECGYYDQSHLINDFRAVTGRTPETFFQDTARAPA